MNGFLTTNVRDKLALLALIGIVVLAFFTLWGAMYLFYASDKDNKLQFIIILIGQVISMILTVIAILAAFFKGNPVSATTSPTTEITTSKIEPSSITSTIVSVPESVLPVPPRAPDPPPMVRPKEEGEL